jgi:hypothetical protein
MSPPLHSHLLSIYNILSLYIHDYVSLLLPCVLESYVCYDHMDQSFALIIGGHLESDESVALTVIHIECFSTCISSLVNITTSDISFN